jgi:CBS domain-containing protein
MTVPPHCKEEAMSAVPSRDRRPQQDPDQGPAPDWAHPGSRPIAEIMSQPVVALTPDRVLNDALDTLVRFGLRHIAVVDHAGRHLGIIADRMIVAAWAHNMSCLHIRRVHELLEPEPAAVRRQTTVTEVARLMAVRGVDAVAVTEVDGTLTGIVTGSDLVALLSRDGQPNRQRR